MHLRTSYEAVATVYPEAVAEIVAKLRSSKSKFKDASPEELDWTFASSVAAQSQGFSEVLDAAKAKLVTKAPKPLSAKKRLEDMVSRTEVYLMAKKDKGAQYYSGALAVVPEVIIAQYKKSIADEDAEAARVATLTPEERRREVASAMRMLGGSGGFMAVNLSAGAKA